MIQIKEIKVTNYKNITKADLSFTNFNVITGPNNSGKSNFLQILSFLDYLINGSADEVENDLKLGVFKSPFTAVNPRFSTKRKEIKETTFSLKLFDTLKEIDYWYELSIVWDKNTYGFNDPGEIASEKFFLKDIHKTGKPIRVFERSGENIVLNAFHKKAINVKKVSNYVSVFRLLKLIPQKGEAGLFVEAIDVLDYILKTPIYYFSNLELLKVNEREKTYIFKGRITSFDLEKEIAALFNTKKWPIFEEALMTILDIRGIHLFEYKDGRKVREEDSFELPVFHCMVKHLNQEKHINELSDGSLLLIALLVKILSSNNSIFLIEEPENSLHPKALSDLIDFMRSYEDEKQFIITSHSVVLINKVKPEEVIVAKISQEGTSELTNIENVKELRRKLKSGYLDFSDYIFFDTEESDEEVSVY